MKKELQSQDISNKLKMKKQIKFKLLKVPQALTQIEANNLIHWYRTHKHLISIGTDPKRAKLEGSSADYLGINIIHIHNVQVRDLVRRLSHLAVAEIYKQADQFVVPEMMNITEWSIGGVQEPHLDTYSNTEIKNDMVDPNPSREWTAIIYLNSNYEGGETYFPPSEYNSVTYTHKPEACEMLLFQGIYHPHGVTPVRRNSRYTIAMWFSSNPDRMFTDRTTKNLEDDHLTLKYSTDFISSRS